MGVFGSGLFDGVEWDILFLKLLRNDCGMVKVFFLDVFRVISLGGGGLGV